MTDPLNITNEMRALDLKQRDWFDQLTPEQQRKFSPYLMIRWGSSVQGTAEFQEYYLLSTNQRLNRHFFSVNASRHKKLLWLMATTISPDFGVQRHTWLAQRRPQAENARCRTVRKLFPHLREDEVQLLANINTEESLDEYSRELGSTD
jgi:hypothetical protein